MHLQRILLAYGAALLFASGQALETEHEAISQTNALTQLRSSEAVPGINQVERHLNVAIPEWLIDWRSIRKLVKQPALSRTAKQKFQASIEKMDETHFWLWYHPHAPNQRNNFAPNKNPLEVYKIMRNSGKPEWQAVYIAKEFEKYIQSFKHGV